MNRITIRGELYTLRELQDEDVLEVEELDELSGNGVQDFLGCDGAIGLFHHDKLIGYLTLLYADGCGELIDKHPENNGWGRMLSNVFLRKEYRGKGLGKAFVEESLKEETHAVFLQILEDSLAKFYEQLGFTLLEDYTMLRSVKSI